MSILCLKISNPLTFCTFSKLTHKINPFQKLYPPTKTTAPLWDVINERFLSSEYTREFVMKFLPAQFS